MSLSSVPDLVKRAFFLLRALWHARLRVRLRISLALSLFGHAHMRYAHVSRSLLSEKGSFIGLFAGLFRHAHLSLAAMQGHPSRVFAEGGSDE